MLYYSLKVLRVITETQDTVTVSFKQPALKKVKYIPGQYLTLVFSINGRRYIRPYSLSSAPDVDATLDVTVKRVPGGVVSNHIVDTVKEGDIIQVMAPMGDFVLPDTDLTSKQLVLWGAGSGITPLMSIAKYALAKGIAKHVMLVYGNRSNESEIFSDQIAAMKASYPDQFSSLHFYTQLSVDPDTNPYIVQGRIDPQQVVSVIREFHALEDTLHYICGPVGLKESARSVLTGLGVQENDIFSEDFEIVRNPADMEDVITANISITLNGVSSVVEVARGKSILEASLDAGVELPYSCQTGSCKVCRGTLLSGKLKTIGIAHLPEELNDDEYLLCCSFPLEAGIDISVVE